MLTTRLLLRSSFGLLLNLYITTLLIKDCERLNIKSALIYKQFERERERERENVYYGDITNDNSPFTLNKHAGTCHCTTTH